MAKKDRNGRKEFVVFGLGKFGLSVAKTLADNGCQVMAVDSEQSKVEEIANGVTYAVCTDVTDADAIHSLGIRNFDGAIVAIGENLEASVLVTIISKEMGIPFVLAKAQTELQAKVLKRVGADKIIFPEKESGIRIANNLVSGNFFDAIELSSKYSMMDLDVPAEWVGKSLRELNLRATKKINIIGIKQKEEFEITPDPDMPLTEDDILVVIGRNQTLTKLAGGN
ncbi:MAG: TrkA family potassium uptake protein [Lachnospiraceae bacterium]|nr:TrkA family potassium uptake protein [Lachnospiraceae bacterium]MBP3578210.1 TrkA family potassium uptake protein [Lachnospiraceae bacterium]